MRNSIARLIVGMAFLACMPMANAAFTFTEAGAEGKDGPTQPQLDTAYLGTELEGSVTSDNGIQIWTVPESGLYQIEILGASGGDAIGTPNGTFYGGLGARVAGEFNLTAGEELKIIVGQRGVSPILAGENDGALGGGGGGSFVWKTSGAEMLAAVGGGGGAGNGYSAGGADGGNATDDVNGSIPAGSEDCVSTATPGEGWVSANHSCGGYFSGGGAGWNSDGEINAYDCTTTPSNAASPLNGGAGGMGNEDSSQTGPGGFGGGGGSAVECGSTGGGGGGGYTGGAGTGCSDGGGCGDGGGGGGSYNSGANPESNPGYQSGNGMVMILLVASAEETQPVPSLSNLSLILLSVLLLMFSWIGLRHRVN